MHIPDGFLSGEVCAATAAVSLGAVGFSVYKLRETLADRLVPLTGMMSAVVFAGQMVNFKLPVVFVSGHLIGGVLAAMVLGPWAGCVAITMVLLVQRFLFSDGGLFALGANVLHMAVIGSIGGYAVATLVRRFFKNRNVGTIVGAVVASWLTVVAASALFCLEFRLSHLQPETDFHTLFALMVGLHSLIGVGEALITGCAVAYILNHRSDLIDAGEPNRSVVAHAGRITAAGIVLALGVAAFLAPFASTAPDGLEEVAKKQGFEGLERPAWSVFESYDKISFHGIDWQGLSVSLAGIVGTVAVFLLALAFGRAISVRSRVTEAGRE